MTSSHDKHRGGEHSRRHHKTKSSKRRISSRTSRFADKDKDKGGGTRPDDKCTISNVKQSSDTFEFVKCIPISVTSLVKDLLDSASMPGETTSERLYNALTINDRLIYAIVALLGMIVSLLLLKLLLQMLSGPQPRRMHAWGPYGPY